MENAFSFLSILSLCTFIFIPFNMAKGQDLISTLEVYDLQNESRTNIYQEEGHFEAPNWSTDSGYFIINQGGHLFTLTADGKEKTILPTGDAVKCNNDHGISPDGTLLAISNNDLITGSSGGTSRIYILPIEGGTPELITPLWPSYWHGWSPDGKHLIYTAERNGIYDLYEIDLATRTEVQVTDHPELDDGPEYSPDGAYIYFNSYRSGTMEIWKMNRKTKKVDQLTNDEFSNWFPHPSPDGKYIVFLSYVKDQQDRHPPLKEVMLRLLDLKTMKLTTLCTFLGGQGTINVPSWSPDSSKFAFVSYSKK
ncbi:MAG: transporter [Flavobacteriaceae bacterium]|nr:transporter [Flavobacteriaceae bacterium]